MEKKLIEIEKKIDELDDKLENILTLMMYLQDKIRL